MHVLRAILILAFAATAVMTPVSAVPRDPKLCAAVAACECPRQARSCAPLCRLEPLIACPTT